MSGVDPLRVILGVGGGIAAYKSVELLRSFMDRGYHVVPLLTPASLNFVGAMTFSALASEPARTDIFDHTDPLAHTSLGRSADLVVVAPATADLIGKFANGLADDILSATLLATRAPVLLAPAMHDEMWSNPAVQRNLGFLLHHGVAVVPPSRGRLAGGDVGMGRMADPKVIATFAAARMSKEFVDLRGRRVLVDAGGTREAIDPVRFVGNRSSGRQGHAFAEVAAAWGAEVTLVTSAQGGEFPNVTVVRVESAEEMRAAVMSNLAEKDLVVLAAAVADFRPADVESAKIKRMGKSVLDLRLVPNGDILVDVVASRPDGCVVVGFAAETNDLEEAVRGKLARKGADLIVGNDVTQEGAGFSGATNSVYILDRSGREVRLERAMKHRVAEVVISMALGG